LAPAVSYPAGGAGYLKWVLAGVVLLGAAALGLYGYHTDAFSKQLTWQWALVAGAWLISAVAVWHFIRHLPRGELDFDGENWYFADLVGTVSVRFDGQNCLLLQFTSEFKQVYWLWLEARLVLSFVPSHWHDLRRAVYSRPASQNSPDLI
jgi:hypothetical protein